MKGKKRLIALLLSFLMVMSQMSVATFALDTVAADNSDQAVTEQAVEETQPDADISTAAVETAPEATESVTETATEPEVAEPAAAEPEKTEPAAEPAKAEAKKAEPKKAEPKEEAFDQSKTVDGVKVTVKAAKGVFPAGSKLSVSSVSVPSAVDTEDAEEAYAFDISILADGKKIQPDGNATVSFTTEEVAEYDTAVYHMDGGAQEMNVSESGSTASVKTDGFSVYVVTFQHNKKPSVTVPFTMKPGEKVNLYKVLGPDGLGYNDIENGRKIKNVRTNSTDLTVSGSPADEPVDPQNVEITLANNPSADEASLTVTFLDPEATAQIPITIEEKYEVTFDPGEAGEDAEGMPEDEVVTPNGTVKKPDDPSWEGHTFLGWKNGTNDYDFSSEVTDDLKLTAAWHTHEWVATTKGSSKVVKCQNTDNKCPYADEEYKFSIDITGKAYDGTPVDAATTTAPEPNPTDVSISDVVRYYTGTSTSGDYETTPPTNIGTYTASVVWYQGVDASGKKVAKGLISKTFQIGKGTPAWDPKAEAVPDSELITDGSDLALIKTPADTTGDGQVLYALIDATSRQAVIGWTDKPADIKYNQSGSYIIQYLAKETDNYNALPVEEIPVKISGPVTVIFDPNGGDGDMNPQTVATGVPAALHANKYTKKDPQYENLDCVFFAWSTDKNAKVPDDGEIPQEDGWYADGEEAAFTADTKLYAIWQEYAHEKDAPQALDLTYNGDDQTLLANGSVVADEGVMEYYADDTKEYSQDIPVGKEAGNYEVKYRIRGLHGHADYYPEEPIPVTIKQKEVTATGFEAEDKPYDGNTDAELVMDGEHVKADIEDLVGDDEVYVESADASFEDAEVGNNKKVNVTNIVLGGADAANYELTSTTAETTASITHEHSWQSEAKEGVVTLTCSQEACPYHDNPIHIYLNAKDVSYDGNPHPAELDTSEIPEELKGQIDVRWKNDTTSQKVFYRKDGSSPEAIEPLEPAVYKGYTRVRYKDSTGKKVTVNLTKEFTISEKTVTIYGVTAEDKVYDGNNTATVNADDAVIEGLVPGDVVTVAVRTEGASNAGLFENEKAGNDKKVTWSTYVLGGADADKYVVSTDSQYEATASIFKKPVTFLWSIDGEEYDPEDPPVYDGKHHIVTALVNPEDIVGEDVVGAHLTGTTEARNVAPFDYTAEVDRLVGKDKDNYKFDLDDETASLNWNLEKADLTIQANDVKLTYGDDPYDNGVTYTGLVASDKSRVNPDRPARGVINGALQFKYHVRGDKKTEYVAGSDASEFVDKGYVVDPKSSELSATNYNITLKVGTLTVNRKHVVFSWDKVNPSKIYDGEPLTVEATTNDIIDQDEDYVIVAYDPDGSNTATNVVNAQDTSAFIDDMTTAVEKAKNYDVDEDSNAENTITITPRLVEVVWQYDGPYTYDGTTKSVSAIIKGAVTGQKLTPVTSGVLEAKDAGSYVAKVTDFEAVDPALKDNYELKSTDRSLTWMINKATVTVTAKDQTIYNTDNYDKAAVSYSGFAPGESASVLTAVPTVSSDYYVNAKAGKYTLVPSGAAAKNYTFRYANGTLTVNEKGTVLVARGRAKGGNTINVSWTNYTGADRYVVYYGICGKTPMKYYKAVWSNTRSLDVTGLSRGTQYKFYVYAQKNVNGSFVNIARSNGLHVIAGNVSGGYTNPSRVVLSRYEGSMPVGGKYKIKASVSKAVPGRDLLGTNHDAQLTYRSSNNNVAKVSKNGVVYAVGKGTCRIYVMSISGVYSTMVLTVH